jgi:hypothetical protein
MIDKPISTCSIESCNSCSIHSRITCHLGLPQLLRFYITVLPSFVIGGIVIYNYSVNSFIGWVTGIGLFFLVIGIRVLCTHCPHYNESSHIMRCWANYGVPKFWRYRPRPMNIFEKAILICGFVFIWGYPVVFISIIKSWIYLGGYVFSVTLFFTLMYLFNCRKCINFSCPLNRVNSKVKEEFLKNNRLFKNECAKTVVFME